MDPIFVDCVWFVRHSVKPNIYRVSSIRQFWPRVRHMSPDQSRVFNASFGRADKKENHEILRMTKSFHLHATQDHGGNEIEETQSCCYVTRLVVRLSAAKRTTARLSHYAHTLSIYNT